jgi:AmiR/NasT family two-component response regulator
MDLQNLQRIRGLSVVLSVLRSANRNREVKGEVMVTATIEPRISTMVQQERIAKLEAENEQLREFLHDNRIVEQATGAISVRYRMTPKDALEMLCDGAESQRRNLRELASRVVANGGSFAGA